MARPTVGLLSATSINVQNACMAFIMVYICPNLSFGSVLLNIYTAVVYNCVSL